MTTYALTTSYVGQGLMDNFDFVSFADPTLGFVSYQNYSSAVSEGLVSIDGSTNAVRLSVDTTNTYPTDGSQGGRPSVRIESKQSVNQGLVIGDFSHMPGSVCGAWPAFWMYGSNWPNNGEIDIIEGANMAYSNLMSAHTSANCVLPSDGFTGTQQKLDCADTAYGCNFVSPITDTSSYGDDFNGVGGGVYALQWTDEAIKIWHFARADIPADIVAKEPNPSAWGLPQALFGSTGCDVPSHFNDMNIVLNIDFCGIYAGNIWAADAQCSTYADTCVDWIANNPDALTELYWEVNYIDVYSPFAAPAEAFTILQDPPTIAAPSILEDPPAVGAPSIVQDLPTPPALSILQDPPTVAASSSISFSPRLSEASSPVTVSVAASVAASATASASAAPASAVTTANVGSVPSPTAGAATTRTGSSTSPANSPVDSVVPIHNPAVIDVFSYIGCFSSPSGFSSFNLSGLDPLLTLEKCVGLCSGKKYAGAVGTSCYCADTLDAGTGAISDRTSCNSPCPGNSAEYCGGSLFPSKRAALSPSVLLTMYANINGLNSTIPPPAPALGSNTTSSATSSLAGVGVGIGATTSLQTITSTITYTTVCSTNPAQLVTLTYCTTITVCPTSFPSIPQTIITQSCAACGKNGSSVVTLTIPVQVAVTRTNVGVVTATGLLWNTPMPVPMPVPTTTFLPVTAAAAPGGVPSGFVVAMLGFVGMLI